MNIFNPIRLRTKKIPYRPDLLGKVVTNFSESLFSGSSESSSRYDPYTGMFAKLVENTYFSSHAFETVCGCLLSRWNTQTLHQRTNSKNSSKLHLSSEIQLLKADREVRFQISQCNPIGFITWNVMNFIEFSHIWPSRLSLTRCISELRWSLEECYGANQRRIIRTERWNHPHGARTLPEEMKWKSHFLCTTE